MKLYLSIIRYPLLYWILYLCLVFIINLFFKNIEFVRRFCNHYSLYLIFLFSFFVYINCSKNNFSYWKTVFSSFLFFYFCSAILWLGYIYSESHVLSRISDVYPAILSFFMYPLAFSIIASFTLSAVYILIKKVI